MCEVVEQYAEERAREAAQKAAKKTESMAARKFFLNGADYKMVQNSMQYLTNTELDAICEEVKNVKI